MNKPLRNRTDESTKSQPHKYGIWSTQAGLWKYLTDDLPTAQDMLKKYGNTPYWYYILYERQPDATGNYNNNANLKILDRSK